ncbi:hypothetical protein GCM10010260_45260 [Streptomyces filipinensis]|uniref:Uncharacterized protein n=1 Tax=Streptomyces filipinensis TaxID=66887 RepID=A0A918MCU0_9ACTN|nr:hypothetical protein [Streptomyces filipinensis]GGV03483.1 hypothetical protein GCM10010260_45260 [Streptomyces filipinensis]
MGIRSSVQIMALSVRLDARLKQIDLTAGTAGLVALDAALEDATRLRRLLEQSRETHVISTVVLIRFHSLRHHLLPLGEGTGDLHIAARLVDAALKSNPALVPGALRACRNADEVAALLVCDRVRRMLTEADATSDRSSLDQAIGLVRAALPCISTANPQRGVVASLLSAAYLTRHQRFHEPEDCDEAVNAGREGVRCSATPSDRARAQFHLGRALLAAFARTTAATELEEAIGLLRASVSATPKTDPAHEPRRDLLAAALQSAEHVEGLLDDGVAISRAVMEITGDGDPYRAQRLEGLGFFLVGRYYKSGSLSDLDEGIAALREAVAASSADDDGLPWRNLQLGESLLLRAQHTGAPGDLDDAVAITRVALSLIPEGDPRTADYLTALAGQLRVRAERGFSVEDLDEAITLGRAAVARAGTDRSHAREGSHGLINLSGALGTRFAWFGALSDLREAIDVSRAAVAAAHSGNRALCLSNLGANLQRLFVWSQEPADLDAALETARAAVEACLRSDQDRKRYLANLAALLSMRVTLGTGPSGDLDEAIAASLAALELTPVGHEDRPRWLAGRALMLRSRAERDRAATEAAEAVTLAQTALDELPAVHADRGQLLSVVASCLDLHAELAASPADARRAIGLWSEAAELAASPVMARITSARAAAYAAASLEPGGTAAADLYAKAVSLLPLVASRAIERRSQEQRLQSVVDVAGDAAACALATDRAERAVELLEQGRNLIWNQTLDAHDDFADLRAHHPELADRLRAVSLGLSDTRLDETGLFPPLAPP